MPIDASIYALQKAPQPLADPGEVLGRAMQIRNQQQANQIGQERLRSEQIQNAERERKQRSATIVRDTFLNAGGDPAKHVQMAAQGGADPDEVQALQKHYTDLAKSAAEADDKTLGVKLKRNEMILPLHDQAIGLAEKDPQAFTQAWPDFLQQAAAIDPDAAKHFSPDQPPTVEQLVASKNLHLTQDYALKTAAEKRAADEAKQKATAATDTHGAAVAALPGTQAKAEAEVRQNDAATLATAAEQGPQALAAALARLPEPRRGPFAGLTAQTKPADIRRIGMDAVQVVTADQQAANAARQERHDAETEKQGAGHLAIARGQLALAQNRYGFEVGGGVSPQAKAAAAGEIAPQTLRMMLRSNPGLMGQIKQVDPNWDEANIDKRYEVLREYNKTSSGTGGGQLIALNTLIHHADLYLETAEALKNGSFRPGNAIYNKVATAFGSAPPTNAALVARFFASETGKVATGGIPAEGEVNGILKNLGTDASPEAIAGAGRTLLQLAGGRAVPHMEKVKDAKLDKVVKVLGDDARGILQKRGFNPDTMKPDGGGTSGAPRINTKAEYDALPSGASYIDAQDGQTYTKKR